MKAGRWISQARIARGWYDSLSNNETVDLNESPFDWEPAGSNNLSTGNYDPMAPIGLGGRGINDSDIFNPSRYDINSVNTENGEQKIPRVYNTADENYAADLRIMHSSPPGVFSPTKERIGASNRDANGNLSQTQYEEITNSIYLVRDLETGNVIKSEAIIYLYGCNNGTQLSESGKQQLHPLEILGSTGIASHFANHFKVPVFGYAESVHFPGKEGMQRPAPESAVNMRMYSPQ